VSYKEGQAELKKKDGKVVTLDVEKLSAADQEYILDLPNVAAARKEAIRLLDEAAALIETVKDGESRRAAYEPAAALGKRALPYVPVLQTAMFLSGEAADRPRDVQANIKRAAETGDDYKKYRTEARAVLADPAFLPAFRRYKGAIATAIKVEDAESLILRPLQIGW